MLPGVEADPGALLVTAAGFGLICKDNLRGGPFLPSFANEAARFVACVMMSRAWALLIAVLAGEAGGGCGCVVDGSGCVYVTVGF